MGPGCPVVGEPPRCVYGGAQQVVSGREIRAFARHHKRDVFQVVVTIAYYNIKDQPLEQPQTGSGLCSDMLDDNFQSRDRSLCVFEAARLIQQLASVYYMQALYRVITLRT